MLWLYMISLTYNLNISHENIMCDANNLLLRIGEKTKILKQLLKS